MEEIAEIVLEREPRGNQLWYTELSNGYWVSTIHRDDMNKAVDASISFLMKIHDVTPADIGRPAHLDMPGDYETMVFRIEDQDNEMGYPELAFARYDTKEEAEAGHREMVEKWRRMSAPEEE